MNSLRILLNVHPIRTSIFHLDYGTNESKQDIINDGLIGNVS